MVYIRHINSALCVLDNFYLIMVKFPNHRELLIAIYILYIILIARVRVQYGKIFYEHAKYFHEPKASENVA